MHHIHQLDANPIIRANSGFQQLFFILFAVSILAIFMNQYFVKALLIVILMMIIIYCLPRGKELSGDH